MCGPICDSYASQVPEGSCGFAAGAVYEAKLKICLRSKTQLFPFGSYLFLLVTFCSSFRFLPFPSIGFFRSFQFLPSIPSVGSFRRFLPLVPSVGSFRWFLPSVPSVGSFGRFLSVLSVPFGSFRFLLVPFGSFRFLLVP